MSNVGRYHGIDYKLQRICDVIRTPTRAWWWFSYVDGVATGDHFATLTDLKTAVDSGHFVD